MSKKKKNDINWICYNQPKIINDKWTIERVINDTGEVVGRFICSSEQEAKKLLQRLVLSIVKVKEDYEFEYVENNDILYLTIPSPDRDTGEFSFCKKNKETGELLQFYDGFETLLEARNTQSKLAGLFQEKKPKKVVKRVGKPLRVSKEAKTLELFQLTKDLMLSGFSKSDILKELKNNSQIEDPVELEKFYNRSIDYFNKRTVEFVDLQNIVNVHVSNYEKVFQLFDSIGFTAGKNRAMELKEKLLGYHREDNILEFNQENTTVIENTVSIYDTNKLNDSEKIALQKYLEKVKT